MASLDNKTLYHPILWFSSHATHSRSTNKQKGILNIHSSVRLSNQWFAFPNTDCDDIFIVLQWMSHNFIVFRLLRHWQIAYQHRGLSRLRPDLWLCPTVPSVDPGDRSCFPLKWTESSRRLSPAKSVLGTLASTRMKSNPIHVSSMSCDCSYQEAVVLCYWKHAQETLSTPEIIVPNGCIVLLASRVKDIDLNFFTVKHDLQFKIQV